MTASPLRVGLVGAGPWASMFHAPVLSGGPETELVAVWARRPEAAAELAAVHGAAVAESFDALVGSCDAVAFAVPPDVQADLAERAARRGRTLLLDKPIAADLAAATRLADAVDAAGVGSLVLFTMRFNGELRRIVAEARQRRWGAARFWNLSGAFLDGPFSQSPWRHERGALLDVGPHAFELLDAVCGPIVGIDSVIVEGPVTSMVCWHDSGARSEIVLSGTASSGIGSGLELRADGESIEPAMSVDLWGLDESDVPGNVRAALVAAASGHGSSLDVHRGLMIQRLVDRAEQLLTR